MECIIVTIFSQTTVLFIVLSFQLLQSLQMDEVATKAYRTLFYEMADMQIDRFMGKWYTVVDSKQVHKEDCSVFYCWSN